MGEPGVGGIGGRGNYDSIVLNGATRYFDTTAFELQPQGFKRNFQRGACDINIYFPQQTNCKGLHGAAFCAWEWKFSDEDLVYSHSIHVDDLEAVSADFEIIAGHGEPP